MQGQVCFIDGDCLRYEIGSCGESMEDGQLVVRSFDYVAELFDERVRQILLGCDCDEYVIYLTNCRDTQPIAKRLYKDLEWEENYRVKLAVTKPYKGNRNGVKPAHYRNLTAWILGSKPHKLANGLEADDLICMDASADKDKFIICTRDKDLRQVEGWHYGWECGKQPEFGPMYVDQLGKIEYDPVKKKITGYGAAFFYAQMVTGDAVDNIPGLPRGGPALAYKTLSECATERQMFEAVYALYQLKRADDYHTYFKEQANLLYILRGDGKRYRPPDA
jgi:hypothetical protein